MSNIHANNGGGLYADIECRSDALLENSNFIYSNYWSHLLIVIAVKKTKLFSQVHYRYFQASIIFANSHIFDCDFSLFGGVCCSFLLDKIIFTLWSETAIHNDPTPVQKDIGDVFWGPFIIHSLIFPTVITAHFCHIVISVPRSEIYISFGSVEISKKRH